MTAVTNARVWAISWPFILSNVTVPILGAVDTAVVGQLGAAAPIGAVGLGAVVLASFYWIFSFLRMGTAGLAAQAHGAGDRAERDATLYRALVIAACAGALIVALQSVVIWASFEVAPASPEVEALARQYLRIRMWGAPATIALYAVNGWLIALERARAVLVLQLWINGINAILDIWFVLGLGWSVEGVAVASLIAEWTGLGLGLWLCRDAFGRAFGPAFARLQDAAALRRMVFVNSAIMLRTVLLQGAFTAFVFLSAGLGDVRLAANQVLLQFLAITAYALDGFATTAETLVGQAVGARKGRDIDHAADLSMRWGLGGSLVMAALFWFAGPAIIDLMTTAPDVRAEARLYLPWIVAAPLIGVASWIYDGIFIGATLTRAMLKVVALSVALYVVLIAALIEPYGNHGLWAALMGMNAARGAAAWLLWRGARPKLSV
ncbi:MATE family efflux transporter, partial [Pseudotabrizicola sp.]|uniref:MATE family efflux transporter n=1 Tax=Pseudotabrizicola sp. TaxID=2939647 RepID=UPI00271FA528